MSQPASVSATDMVSQSMSQFFPGIVPVPAAPEAPPAPAPVVPAAPAAPETVVPNAAAPAEPSPSVASRYTQEPVTVQPPASGGAEIPEVPPGTPEKPSSPQELYTWGKLRTEAKRFEQEAQNARSELDNLKKQTEIEAQNKARLAKELEQQKQREAELTEKLGRLSLSESPEFQEKYGLKLAEVKAKLGKALVKFAGVPEGEQTAFSDKLLASSPAELPDLLQGLNPSVAGMILNITTEAATIEEAKAQELANWKTSSAAAQSVQTREAMVAQTEQRRKSSEGAVEFAKKLGNPVFASSDPKVQEVAQKLSQEFHGFVQTATEDQLIRAAAEGFTAPYLVETVLQLEAQVASLNDQLAGRIRASQPPISAFAPPPPAPPPAEPPKNVTLARPANSPHAFAEDAIRASFAQFQQQV